MDSARIMEMSITWRERGEEVVNIARLDDLYNGKKVIYELSYNFKISLLKQRSCASE